MNRMTEENLKLKHEKTVLVVANRELISLVEELTIGLIWCGGSDDFAQGGKAVQGWDNGIKPLIINAKERIKKIKEDKDYWDIR